MARPKKKGLSYFPLDVDVFEDDKLFDVQNDYGPLGESIYFRLLCLVYKNGYYYKFESLDKLAAMMIRSIGNRWAKDKKTVKEVILYLAKINLFSEELMHRNVITSRSIQERYLSAVERRQSKIEEYNLLEKDDFHEGLFSVPKKPITATETPVNVAETSVNVDDNPTKESKGKKSKEEYVCVPPGTPTHTEAEISEMISRMGYAWDAEEIRRFIAYNNETSWKYSPEYSAQKWEENRKRRYQSRKHDEPEMTQREIEEMNAYLSTVNRHRKD